MEKTAFEIERKFLIRMPSCAWLLSASAEIWEMEQTYLLAENGESRRVRRIAQNGKIEYILTSKRRISDIKRIETETDISESEYKSFLEKADPERRTICKTRYRIPRGEHLFEIDVFPFWEDKAFLEVELSSEEEAFTLPKEAEVIREVTADRRYTNAAMAKELPE